MTIHLSPEAVDDAHAEGVLIVGACQAGVQLAASLRDLGWSKPITLVGAEPHLPYQRPPLSKKALHDGIVPADLALRSEAFFAEKSIDLVLGEKVATVTVTADGHRFASTETGRRLPFARLALTTGARPRRLDLPGAALAGIHYLRDSADADRLRQSLVSRPRTVVIGGGFIGLEVAATARRLGCEVSVVLADDRIMSRAVSPFVSSRFHALHQSHGIDISTQAMPVAFLDDGTGRVGGVQLADGRVLPAQVVVVGVGAQPRTELAEQLGLDVRGGIVVDGHALTSDGVTVAAGDCTVWPADGTGHGAARFESVNAATEQAKVAAATIVGRPQPWTSAPWFWSDQFDFKLQVAGIVPATATTLLRRETASTAATVLHYETDRLVAVECINRPADFLAAKSAIAAGRTIDPTRAHDPSIPLKSLIADFTNASVAATRARSAPDSTPGGGSDIPVNPTVEGTAEVEDPDAVSEEAVA